MTMTHGETPAPIRRQGIASDQRCEAARASVAALLAGGRTLADESGLRAHLNVCEACNSLYRELLLADARLRRTLVEQDGRYDSPEEESMTPRRAILSPLAIARAGFKSTGRGKATWVVVLAVIVYATIRLTPDPSGVARAHLSALEGRVVSIGEPLAVGEPGRELQRGDWLRTPEGTRAQLQLGATRVEVAPSSAVQIEEPSTRRLRLEAGSLEVHGPLIVTSRFGIVEVEEGHVTLSIDARGLAVESTRGSVRTIDAGGERELATGESTQLAFAR